MYLYALMQVLCVRMMRRGRWIRLTVTSTSIELCTLNVTRGLQNCTVHRQNSQKITAIIHTYNYIYHCKNKLVVLTTVVTLVADKLKCIKTTTEEASRLFYNQDIAVM